MKFHGVMIGMGCPKGEPFFVLAEVDILNEDPGFFLLIVFNHEFCDGA